MTKVRTALHGLRHYVHSRGVGPALVKLARHYVAGTDRWYVNRAYFSDWVDVPRRNPGIDVRAAVASDLAALVATGRQEPRTFEHWLRPDCFFFVAMDGDGLVGYRVLSRTPNPWVAPFFRMGPHQVFSLDIFTAPAFRGRGISQDLLVVTHERMAALGFRDVVSIQRIDNQESIAMTRGRAFHRLGILTRRCALGRVSFTFEPDTPGARARVGDVVAA